MLYYIKVNSEGKLKQSTGGDKMNMKEALNILRPKDKDDLKRAYKEAALKYHPDHGGDLEIMKLVNLAYEFLNENDWHTAEMRRAAKMEPEILEAIKNIWDALKRMPGISGEVCGTWLWVTGDTRTFKDAFKKMGLKFSGKKVAWYWRPEGYKKRTKKNFDLDDIRNIFGKTDLENEIGMALN